MPSISLLDLINERAETSVQWKGHEVTLVYRPFNDAVAEKLGAVLTHKGVAGMGRVAAEALAAVLLEIGLTDGDGQPVAPTVENLAPLPSAFLMACVVAVTNHMFADPKGPAETSDAGSDTEEASAAS
jgi:hypothetical protein